MVGDSVSTTTHVISITNHIATTKTTAPTITSPSTKSHVRNNNNMSQYTKAQKTQHTQTNNAPAPAARSWGTVPGRRPPPSCSMPPTIVIPEMALVIAIRGECSACVTPCEDGVVCSVAKCDVGDKQFVKMRKTTNKNNAVAEYIKKVACEYRVPWGQQATV